MSIGDRRERRDNVGNLRLSASFWRVLVVVTIALGGVTVGFVSLYLATIAQNDGRTISPSLWAAGAAIVGVVAGAASFPLFSYLRRVRYIDVRVALTGRPRAGKTMFSVGLFNALLGERQNRVQFTAESRTVISVYQAINNISRNVWPQSTPLDVVNRYEGRLRYGQSRNGIDLELGDSAGEYWASVEGGADSSYLNYVMSADAIAHVIPADEVRLAHEDPAPFSLKQERNDLLLASRLARSARKRQHLLIVLSKMDLVCEDPEILERVCLKVWPGHSHRLLSALEETLGDHRWEVEQFIDSIRAEFASVSVTFSSVTSESVETYAREEVSQWLLDISRG